MAKNKPKKNITTDDRLEKIADMLEKLIAVELYKGGATQPEIAENLNVAVGTVNKFVKGIKPKKENGKSS